MRRQEFAFLMARGSVFTTWRSHEPIVGLIVNNKGTADERVEECVQALEASSAFFASNKDILSKPLPNEEVLDKAMRTTIGGMDLYGHLVQTLRKHRAHVISQHTAQLQTHRSGLSVSHCVN
mmetsp:Transcript_4761/g.14135  ORF Transcript_4761/g.14135 Transcript_4761/m.14135 type:complete len:122 (-) Transcript_4761:355-720(-)